MATDIERLILEISANTKGLERGLNGLNAKVDRATGKVERQFKRTNKNILMSTTSMTRDLGGALAAVGVAYATREVIAYADAWTSAANKLAAAGIATDRVAGTQGRLADIARETRAELETTIDLYARMRRSTEDLAVADEAVARATEIVNKAFKAGGSTIQEQNAAIVQLGQALGSGVLQGDELRSIRENAPLVAKAIADEFGVSIAGLKKLGAEGKLTSDRVFKAIIKSGEDVDAQFAKTEATVADAFQGLRTSAIEWIGTQNEALGATEAFTGFLNYAAQNLDTFANATIVGATILGGVFAGQAVMAAIQGSIKLAATLGITRAAMIAQGGAATFAAGGMNALRASMAFLGGPWGIAIAAIATAIGLIWYEANRSIPPTEALTGAVSSLDQALQAYETAAITASAASGENRKSAVEEANALRVVAQEARIAAGEKINLARATLAAAAAAQADYSRRIAFENAPGGNRGDRPGSLGPVGGPSRGAVRQAQADVKAGEEALARAEAQLTRIDSLLNKPLTGAPPAVDTGGAAGGRGRRGPSPEDIRAEAELQAARARGDEATIQRLEEAAELKRRIADYEDAGLAKAQATAAAMADTALVNAAIVEAQERERAIMAEDVRLQAARLSGDEDLIRSIERGIELRERAKAYEETGLQTAEARAKAEADLAVIEAGRLAGTRRAVADAQAEVSLQAAELSGNIELSRELSLQLDRREMITDYQSRGLSLVAATAQAEADLTRLEAARAEARRRFWREEEEAQARRIAQAVGDERRVRELDRAEEIRSRSERYRDQGRMAPADAERRARTEVDAEAIAGVRGQFRDAFKDGWKAALDGDFEDWLAEKAAAGLEKAAQRGLEMLADFAFDQLQAAFPELINQAAGIGEDASAALTMGTAISTATATGAIELGTAITAANTTGAIEVGAAITGAGTIAAAEMGAAILAAGQAAAAAMAAASASGGAGDTVSSIANVVGSIRGTGRAGGKGVRAGITYPINEFGREGFSPGFNGTIVPANIMKALAAVRPGGYGRGTADLRVKLENMGEPFRIEERKGPNGEAILRLQPIMDRAIDANARSGKMRKSLKQSPQPERSF